ncbi:hypothetical protein ABZ470_31885 [Streptosporangium sp. NPDC020072]|uniref:DUF7296 family protein n=1 Tax=Streptosporangium sp. NPDC020072 TaxID=3154788 RepID=UPI0034413FBD
MPFFTYRQNNSFGRFSYDDTEGVSCYVIVEAADAADADMYAQNIGLYFDGEGDCPCCGSRWSAQDSPWGTEPGDDDPSVFGQNLLDPGAHLLSGWMGDRPEGFIHYLDGRMEAFYAPNGDLLERVSIRRVAWVNGQEAELPAAAA